MSPRSKALMAVWVVPKPALEVGWGLDLVGEFLAEAEDEAAVLGLEDEGGQLGALHGHLDGVLVVAADDVAAAAQQGLHGLGAAGKLGDPGLTAVLGEEVLADGDEEGHVTVEGEAAAGEADLCARLGDGGGGEGGGRCDESGAAAKHGGSSFMALTPANHALPSARTAGDAEQGFWVDGLVAAEDGEEDVGAVGDTGAGDVAEGLTGADVAFALGDGRDEVAEVGVEGDGAVGVLEVDGDPAEALALDDQDAAVCGGVHEGAGRGRKVHAVVEGGGGIRADGVAHAEGGGDAGRGDGRQEGGKGCGHSRDPAPQGRLPQRVGAHSIAGNGPFPSAPRDPCDSCLHDGAGDQLRADPCGR